MVSDHFTSRRQFATEKRDQPQRSSQAIAATRMRDKEGWVEQQIQAAIARGDFDNLPGSGKPLNDLGTVQDRDWWIKRLVEREHISGVLPAPLQLRKDDAELDDRLESAASKRTHAEWSKISTPASCTPATHPETISRRLSPCRAM